jgi:hypothetical protein
VADGAGTTLFSGAWADVLVHSFLTAPLLDNDPFEVEWWVRRAQEEFKHRFPAQTGLAWNAQQKVQSQGSYSTLATLRFTALDAAHARAEMLAVGDSCIFVHQATEVLSFPLAQTEEFEQAPICIPSKPGSFQRYFQQFTTGTLDLAPNDVIVIATDAVAKWIVSAGNGHYKGQRTALQEIINQTVESWPAFIQACRAHQEMLDDDSTALVITLLPDDSDTGSELGTTMQHSQQVRMQRQQDFQQALADQNKERIAIYYGSGVDLRDGAVPVSARDISQARAVADALHELLSRLRQVVNSPNVVPVMTTVWQKHARLLSQESCAAPVRNTLTHLGVPLEPRAELASMDTVILPPPSPPPTPSENETEDEHAGMLMTQTFEIPHPTQADQQTEET